MSIIKKLKTDFRGYICFQVFRKKGMYMHRVISTLYMKTKLSFKGIKHKGNIRFHGKTIFVRYPESKIEIGNSCIFASDSKMNLAGINRKCTISTHSKTAHIIIGDDSKLSGAVIGALDKVELGRGVLVGANAFISDFDWHNVDPLKREALSESASPVIIEDNVWVGMNSLILKGVRIGKNSVIGANSVVVKDIPENVVAAGNPCKVLRQI